MRGRRRIRAACLVAGTAVGVVVFTACAGNASGPESTTTTSPSVSPTSKATLPGPNNFSPGPVTPMNPTVKSNDEPVKTP
jgi:hypothetical protein